MTGAPIKTVDDLIAHGFANATDRDALSDVVERYALSIPAHLHRHIAASNQTEPLTRQFVPEVRELRHDPSERPDPIGDHDHTPVAGVVHRYEDRALLKIISVCPVYCRFCFRREMIGPGPAATLSDTEVCNAIAYIAKTASIEEVIMTGGDPLALSPRRIRDVTQQLSNIPHLKRLRWHSRVPIVCPERVTDDLVAALCDTDLQVRVAVHTNHADELSAAARQACERLTLAGVTLLSQSVLLAGINDTTPALKALFEMLSDVGIAPYYLHQLDLAPGTSHFRVPIRQGRALLDTLTRSSPDLVQPAYMLDIPGGFGKIPLTYRHARLIEQRNDGDLYRICDPKGGIHVYLDRAPPRP